MARVKLTLASIKELDNRRVAEEFQFELAHVVKDCYDRPKDGNPRRVQLQVAVVPKGDTGEYVEVEIEIKSTVPPRRSRPFEIAVAPREGDLIFNDASQDDVRQRTLDETGEQAASDPSPVTGGAGGGKGLKYDDLKGLPK